jgi:formylglycine-generating enzyme
MSKKQTIRKLFTLSLLLILFVFVLGYGGGNGNSGSLLASFSIAMSRVPGAASFPTGIDDNDTCTTMNYPYFIAQTEVTYELWSTVYTWAKTHGYAFGNKGKKGSHGSGSDQKPVTTVSWRDAMVWCNALTEYYNTQNGTSLACVYTYNGAIVRDSRHSNLTACDNVIAGSTAKGFRLPTSNEWELAARYQNGTNWTPGNHVSGDTTSYCYPSDADTSAVFGNYAWYSGNSGGSTHPVASTPQKNALGLYDMSGNVLEWCFDWYPGHEGSYRVLRGGDWFDGASLLPLGYVFRCDPDKTFYCLGFRPVRTE